MRDNILKDLFVLEMANNHWGSVKRGLKIINTYGRIVRANSVKAAIKLQFRDSDSFIHPDYKDLDERYIKKTKETFMSPTDFGKLVHQIKRVGCIPMSTPFDEKSVALCADLNLEIIKIASSDITDWPLIEKIGELKKPTVVSSGGAKENDLDNIVKFFENRKIPLAINHCVSLYPSEDSQLELNQIQYLINRYPENLIGFSTHEYSDWSSSIMISYTLGARTWERHVDVDDGEYPISKYCSTPEQVDTWFKSYYKTKEMLQGPTDTRRVITKDERGYLDSLTRGIYAKKDLKKGYVFTKDSFRNDFFLSIPLHKGQLSCNEIINDSVLIKDIKENDILSVEHIDSPYNTNSQLKKIIDERGYDFKKVVKLAKS